VVFYFQKGISMLELFKRYFNPPKAHVIAERDLEEYQRKLLQHQEATGFHGKMVEFYLEGIERLSKAKQIDY
jgi:hypothetical protein